MNAGVCTKSRADATMAIPEEWWHFSEGIGSVAMMFRRRGGVWFSLIMGLIVAGLTGCPDPTDCSNPANAETCGKDNVELVVSVPSPIARMRAGEKAELGVTVERKGDWPTQGEVTLSAQDLIGGVTMEPVHVAADATEATLKFVAGEAVAQGAFPFTLLATPADTRIATTEAAMEAVVPGPAGSRDLSFGDDGQVTLEGEYDVKAVKFDSQGGSLFAGVGPNSKPMLMRLTPSGEAEAPFNEAVQATLNEDLVSIVWDVVVSESDLFVLGERRIGQSLLDFQEVVARYNFQGVLDGAFGENGTNVLEVFGGLGVRKLMFRSDDVLVVTGGPAVSLTYDGRTNTDFAEGGVLADVPFATDALMRRDGVIFLNSPTGVWTINGDVVAPYPSDLDNLYERISVLDTQATSSSITRCAFGSVDLYCVGVFYGEDGLSTGGWAAKVSPDGALDPTFGSGGILTRFLGEGTNAGYENVEVLAADHFLLCELLVTDEQKNYFARYKPDGSLDESFGDAGRIEVDRCPSNHRLPVEHVRGRVMGYVIKNGTVTITRYWL